MLKLCGCHVSNYHNKARIVLLEKGVPFEEDATCRPSQQEEFLARTPIGKVPFLELDGGRRLSESEVIFEYLEDAYPQQPLVPEEPLPEKAAAAEGSLPARQGARAGEVHRAAPGAGGSPAVRRAVLQARPG